MQHEQTMQEQAVSLTKQIAEVDAKIAELQNNRAGIMKVLRAIKGKLVTIELNKSAAE